MNQNQMQQNQRPPKPLALQSIRDSLKLKLFHDSKQQRRQNTLAHQAVVKGCSTPDNQTESSDVVSFPSPRKKESSSKNDSPGKNDSPLMKLAGFSFDDEWETGNYIGEGGHALVKRCYKRKTDNSSSPSRRMAIGKECAVKIFRTGDPEIVNMIKVTFSNNRLLHDSKHVIKAHDLYINERKEIIHLVMEFCEFPSLENAMRKRIARPQIQKIIDEMAQAVEFLHQKGVAHRDLKPDNILVKLDAQQVELKIIDFGVSKRFLQKSRNFSQQRDMWTRTGCIFYQAPEIFQGGGYNQQVDIWSIGVMLYQMLCNKLPFQTETIMDTIAMISEQSDSYEHDPAFKKLTHLEQDLLRRLLKLDPQKRLTASELRLHPWLKASYSQAPVQKKVSYDDSAVAVQYRAPEFDMAQSHQFGAISTNFRQSEVARNQINEEDNEEESSASMNELWDFMDHIHYVRNEVVGFTPYQGFGLKLNRITSDNGNSQDMNYSNKLESSGKSSIVEGGSPIHKPTSQPITIDSVLQVHGENRRESLEFPGN